MRKTLAVTVVAALLVSLLATASSARTTSKVRIDSLDPEVVAILASLSPGDMTTVVVTLRQQVDPAAVTGRTRAIRLRRMIRALQAMADGSQVPLRALLRIRAAQGKVARVAPLWILNGISVTATADVIQELAARSDVASITPDDVPVVPTDGPPEPNQTTVEAPAVWDLGNTGQGVVVANLDSGVDVSHPDLASRWRGGTNSWYDPYDEHPSTPTDLMGHGTATMGVIVGGDAGGTTIGTAPGATWIAAKIFNDQGGATATAIHQAFEWVLDPDRDPNTDDAPQVVNGSWSIGAGPGCDLSFQPDLQALRAADILPVFAAGNYGSGGSTSVSPANYPESLAVGAVSGTDLIYSASSRGPSTCGGRSGVFPDLAAPGVDIRTTDRFGLYQTATGTSMSAPHVAGALALLLGATPGLSADQQQAALAGTALDLGTPGPDDDYGLGRLDILAAYQSLQGEPDIAGPATRSPILTPGLTNGSGTEGVAVSATGDDTASGGSDISAAEYYVDTVGPDGSGTPMTVDPFGPVASLDAVISAATVNALAEGPHVVSIHSQDAPANWGDPVTVNLVVDKTGPSTSGVSVDPNPNNGTLPVNPSTPAVRVSATTLSDPIAGSVNSPISAGEAFIDSVSADGSGIPMSASDGVFDDLSEGGYADIPLATVAALSNGTHTFHVHAKDEAGNWGPMTTTTLVVDKVRPTLTGLSASPNPTQGATSVNLTATAADAGTPVTRAEWFRGTDPGAGNATPMTVGGTGPWNLSATIDVSNWNEGAHVIRVRARDAAGNWSVLSTSTLNVRGPLSFSTFGNTNPPGVAGAADDADIYGWNGTSYSRTIDVSAAPYGLPAAANVDGFDRVDATHFYLSFSADNTTVPGLGAVQDEDVVFYNAGTWSVYFNGTANGLTTANEDLDAISVAGGTVYFSTQGSTNPPGVGGAADDADIYSWNGTSYARVWDATTNGLPAGANVDGFVRVDATHFYLSFSAATTTVPGVGTVQDEDVVYHNAGTWSVYFDGTAHGLSAANHDVDAFDVP